MRALVSLSSRVGSMVHGVCVCVCADGPPRFSVSAVAPSDVLQEQNAKDSSVVDKLEKTYAAEVEKSRKDRLVEPRNLVMCGCTNVSPCEALDSV